MAFAHETLWKAESYMFTVVIDDSCISVNHSSVNRVNEQQGDANHIL